MRQIKRLSRSVLSAPTLLSLSVSDRQSHPRAHWPAFQGRDVPGDVSGCVQYQSLFPDCVNEILGLCLPDERQSTHTDKYLPIYHHLYQWYCQYHYLTNIGHCQVLSELNNQKTFQFRSLGRSQALALSPISTWLYGLPWPTNRLENRPGGIPTSVVSWCFFWVGGTEKKYWTL